MAWYEHVRFFLNCFMTKVLLLFLILQHCHYDATNKHGLSYNWLTANCAERAFCLLYSWFASVCRKMCIIIFKYIFSHGCIRLVLYRELQRFVHTDFCFSKMEWQYHHSARGGQEYNGSLRKTLTNARYCMCAFCWLVLLQ